MQVGIFARQDNFQARSILARMNRLRPRSARLFDTSLDGRAAVAMDGDKLTWGRRLLNRLDWAFVHGFRYQDPVVPSPEELTDWSLWQPAYVAEQQKYSFLFSLLTRLEAAGVRLCNGAAVLLAAYAKPAQLQGLGRRGVPVPEMICTNDLRAADRFCKEHGQVVWRTATGRCAWQLFGDRQKEHLVSPSAPPVLLAPVVPGPLLRAYVFEGRTLACYDHAAPDCEGLERMEWLRPADPRKHAGILSRIAKISGAAWFVAQLVDGPGGPVVYDVDADPVLAGLPGNIRDFLAEELARGLLGLGPDKGTPPGPAERESLFLRRMTRILFDIEATKHRES